jgi:hypothetical protein
MCKFSEVLKNIVVGDIFHASSPNSASLICLAVSVSETTIVSRTVTTQICLDFDRSTGKALWIETAVICTIDSVTPLPVEVHNTILSIDRKFRLEQSEDRLKLNRSEIQALLFVDAHYTENPIFSNAR